MIASIVKHERQTIDATANALVERPCPIPFCPKVVVAAIAPCIKCTARHAPLVTSFDRPRRILPRPTCLKRQRARIYP